MGCYEDFEVGDDFILWGNNMAEMHPVLFSRILANKRKNPGVRIVDIGTRRTPTTDYADMYVEFIPGSDLALANGILHLLVRDGKISRAFLNENVVFKRGIEDIDQIGFGSWGEDGLGLDPSDGPAEHYRFKDQGRDASLAELEEFLAHYTPEHVSEVSGVPVGQIHALAEMYGDPGRGTVSTWCMGVNQHTRGTWMNNLITDLHLITGKISRPGANPFSLTGQPSACGTVREVGTLAHRLPARGRNSGASTAGGHGGDEPGTQGQGRGDMGCPIGHDQPEARPAHDGHVPRLHARRGEGDVDADHESVGQHPEPEPDQA
jgi:nitrate reductase NapA